MEPAHFVYKTSSHSTTHDAVSHPSHYASGAVECIEAIKEALGENQFIGYLRGNIMKYLWRFDKKENRRQDLEKAQWYMNYLVDYERRIHGD